MEGIVLRCITNVFIFGLAKFLVCDTDFVIVSFQTFGQDENLITWCIYEILMRIVVYPILCFYFEWNFIGLILLVPLLFIHLLFHMLSVNNMHMIVDGTNHYTTKKTIVVGVPFVFGRTSPRH